ncbi:hypothetical protein [Agrobacterium tumefaciens]|uniref:Invasion associated locus B family protein n=1 Tax=Agrobacterium tumefaciens TaxID=358 RepID=A0AA44JAN2_AGRTU|nr:hypothetical protein [Agrobacterium tumefaciens]NTB86839.1 hypothetical protein [Agrobacterium tumefaciens]NTC21168.1 hypothetical protein [Agrobacterium tumefaciens]NTC30716.1 hypothetical protein [Agrobacterium tumefaciens]
MSKISILSTGFVAALMLLPTGANTSGFDDYPISYGNWEGVCNKYSCVVRNNRNVAIQFDLDGDMWVQFPVSKKQLEEARMLKVTLPNGTKFEEFKRPGINQTLRLTIPKKQQKVFVKTKKFTIEGIGEFDVRNFDGLYEAGAFRLGINQ